MRFQYVTVEWETEKCMLWYKDGGGDKADIMPLLCDTPDSSDLEKPEALSGIERSIPGRSSQTSGLATTRSDSFNSVQIAERRGMEQVLA